MKTIITTSKPKSLLSNSMWNISLTIWQIGVTFLLTPMLIAKLGIDHYGLMVLLLTVSGFMGIMNFGLGEATLRFVSYYYGKNDLEGINRVVSTTLTVYIFIGILAWSILFFGASYIIDLMSIDTIEKSSMIDLLHLISFSVSFGFFGAAFGSIPQALQRFDISTRVSIIQSIFYVTGTILILVCCPGIKELLMWNVATVVFTQLIYLVIAKHLILGLRVIPSMNLAGLKEIFGFSIYSFISHIFGLIHSYSDRLLAGTMVSSTAVAYLSVPQQLSFRASQAVNSAGAVLFPKFSTFSGIEQQKKLFLDSSWILLIFSILVFVPLTVLLPDFLSLWINPEFAANSAWLSQVIASSFILRGAFASYSALFNGMGKPQYMSIVLFLTGSTSLVVNFLLITIYGFQGLGYAYWATPFWGVLTIGFTWFYVFEERNFLPLIRVFLVPATIGFISLIILTLLLENYPIDRWLIMFGAVVLIIVMISFLLLLSEYIMGGSASRVILVLKVFQRKKIE